MTLQRGSVTSDKYALVINLLIVLTLCKAVWFSECMTLRWIQGEHEQKKLHER